MGEDYMNVLNICELSEKFKYIFLCGVLVCVSNLATAADRDSVVRTNNKVAVTKTGEDISFVRTYNYRANDDDSKNSSKKKAIEQIKIELNDEVGTYIESYLEINYEAQPDVSRKDVKQEINSISAGITRVKILEEKWDGKTYYIKAKVDLNPKQAMVALTEAIKSKAAEEDVKRLNLILGEQKKQINASNKRVEKVQKKLLSQEIINKARKTELDKINAQLTQAKLLLKKYNIEIGKNKTELEELELKVDKAKRRIVTNGKKACLMIAGMTIDEVTDAIGVPDASDGSAYLLGGDLYYGGTRLYFSNKLLKGIYDCK